MILSLRSLHKAPKRFGLIASSLKVSSNFTDAGTLPGKLLDVRLGCFVYSQFFGFEVA